MNEIDGGPVQPIVWQKDRLVLLDQRALPELETYVEVHSADEAAAAIRAMVVRGAPAIGIAAAYAVVLAAQRHLERGSADWKRVLQGDLQRLRESRPTAVNLHWAVNRMSRAVSEAPQDDPLSWLLAEAKRIHTEDVTANRRMGDLGARLIERGSRVLTHCNTGALATGGYGTALGVIRSAYYGGRIVEVYVDETRPWFQGSRLTAWELVREGIPTTVIPDSAAAHLMRRLGFAWIIVGADRIAANGDVANKIGTYSLAVNARRHGIGFMVVAPTSTIDPAAANGDCVPLENRDESEVLTIDGKRLAPRGARACNPVFDVTPAELVDVIVTENGVIERPDPAGIRSLLQPVTE